MPAAAVPRDAATVIVLRDGEPGFQVFMLRRHGRSAFAPDMWVFPGGAVDEADGALPRRQWAGIDPERLASRFNTSPQMVLAVHVAAARETFEEAGLLLARSTAGAPPDLSDPDLLRLRHDLADRTKRVGFSAWLERQDLVLDLGALTYHSHWVTPAVEHRRYDTRFFVARAPREQIATYDRRETTDEQWITPAAALAAFSRGELQLMYPTVKTLAALAAFDSIDAVRAAADAQDTIRRIQPHAELDEQGNFVRVLHPDDPEFPSHLHQGTP